MYDKITIVILVKENITMQHVRVYMMRIFCLYRTACCPFRIAASFSEKCDELWEFAWSGIRDIQPWWTGRSKSFFLFPSAHYFTLLCFVFIFLFSFFACNCIKKPQNFLHCNGNRIRLLFRICARHENDLPWARTQDVVLLNCQTGINIQVKKNEEMNSGSLKLVRRKGKKGKSVWCYRCSDSWPTNSHAKFR